MMTTLLFTKNGGGAMGASAERIAALDQKVAALTQAQKAGRVGAAFPPDFLPVAVLSLATAWSVASPYGPSIKGKVKGAQHTAALRHIVTEAARLLAERGGAPRITGRSKSR
jgi:hypothetical protein